MNRWKNYGLWVALFSLAGLLFNDYLPENYQDISTAILSVLVAGGIISNPKEGSGFLDVNTNNNKQDGT